MHSLKNKIILLLGLIISIFLCAGVGFAQSPPSIELSPSQQGERSFNQVKYYSAGDLQTVIITGEKSTPGIAAYDIELDLEARTYTATQVKGEQLQSIIDCIPVKESRTTNNEDNNYFVGVRVTTTDPPPINEPLNETLQMLSWGSDGISSYLIARYKNAWAAYPTYFNTHWFVDEDKWTGLRYLDLGRTVASSNYASYYNYDFMFDGLRTDVSHEITIEGYRTGSYTIYTTTEKSGEWQSLLRFTVVEI